MRQLIIGILSILTFSCQSQELKYRSVETYFEQIAELEINELIEQNILIDSTTIADKYLDKESKGLNEDGFMKYSESDWKNDDKLSRDKLKTDSSLTKIFWNYDEGPKNMENIKLFIENDYLVFERGNLYHSLYDLKTDSLLFNEESPWHASNGENKDKMNEWIKTNLHDKIEEKLNEKRK